MVRTAAPWRRFLATYFDWLFILTTIGLFSFLPDIIVGSLFFCTCFLYQPLFESSSMQATLGEYFVNIKITSLQGDRITLRRAFVRLLSTIPVAVLFVALFCGVLYGVILFVDTTSLLQEQRFAEFFEKTFPLSLAGMLFAFLFLIGTYACLFFVRLCSKGNQTLQDYFSGTLMQFREPTELQ